MAQKGPLGNHIVAASYQQTISGQTIPPRTEHRLHGGELTGLGAQAPLFGKDGPSRTPPSIEQTLSLGTRIRGTGRNTPVAS